MMRRLWVVLVASMMVCVAIGLTQKNADFEEDIILCDEVAEESTEVAEIHEISRNMVLACSIECNAAETEVETDVEADYAKYEIYGKTDPYYRYMAEKLDDVGLIDFYPYAECQSYQESGWNPEARHVCDDGSVDIGYLQFNSAWWESYCNEYNFYGDIYDPYDQIDMYVKIVSAAYARGEYLCTVISNHYTGGVYYDAGYVDDVLSWTDYLMRVKEDA